jgi:peptidoglycan hydrolase-like protein with peptidoglycan-binding domain
MSARGMLSVVGNAVGGLIGWSEAPPPADPECLRTLLTDLGREPGDSEEELTEEVRAFQARAGLTPDGVAGPRTVHVLVRKAREARDLRVDLAAWPREAAPGRGFGLVA